MCSALPSHANSCRSALASQPPQAPARRAGRWRAAAASGVWRADIIACSLNPIQHSRRTKLPASVVSQPSMLTARSWPQCAQVTNRPRTPSQRMLPSVIRRIGSSFLAMPAS
jgi:hypothetical protein